jgi:hypothetical protein
MLELMPSTATTNHKEPNPDGEEGSLQAQLLVPATGTTVSHRIPFLQLFRHYFVSSKLFFTLPSPRSNHDETFEVGGR